MAAALVWILKTDARAPDVSIVAGPFPYEQEELIEDALCSLLDEDPEATYEYLCLDESRQTYLESIEQDYIDSLTFADEFEADADVPPVHVKK